MIPNADADHQLLQPKRVRLHVTGILQLSGQLDHSFAMIPMQDAQQYLEMGSSVTGIAIKVTDVFHANKLVRDAGEGDQQLRLHQELDRHLWLYVSRHPDDPRHCMYLAMVLVIGVACFNIVSTLVMAVKDKSGDIAVLRTLGAKDGLIRAIFVWYGLLAGSVGSLFGVVIRRDLRVEPDVDHQRHREYLIGHKFLSGDIYFIDFLPSEIALAGRLLCAGDSTVAEFAGQLVSRPPRQPHRPGEGAEWPVIYRHRRPG